MAKKSDDVLIEVRPFYTVDCKLRSDMYGLSIPDSDRVVKEEFKDECDINLIMQRFAKTGLVTHINKNEGIYGDVSELVGYQESLAIVERAEMAFMELPAELRKEMDNDPSRLMSWVQNKDNFDKAVKYGLLVPPKKEVVQKVEVINPVPPVVK